MEAHRGIECTHRENLVGKCLPIGREDMVWQSYKHAGAHPPNRKWNGTPHREQYRLLSV